MGLTQWTMSFVLLSFICLLKIPLMSSAPQGDPPNASSVSTSNRTFLSSLQATSENFVNPQSSCIFPPRNLFLPQSPYKTLCPNISNLNENDGVMHVSDFNNSICLAIRFASAKLCTNDTTTTIQNVSVLPLTAEVLINSNANSTVEAFCEEFEKAVHLRAEQSNKEIDEFFNSFFGKTQPGAANYCYDNCNSTNTSVKINVLCTLANIGFEMIQSLNYTATHVSDSEKKIEILSLKKDVEVPASNEGAESKKKTLEPTENKEDKKTPVLEKTDNSKTTVDSHSQSPILSPPDKRANNQSENKANPQQQDAQNSQVISSKPEQQEKPPVDKPVSVPPASVSTNSPKIQESDDLKPPVLEIKPSSSTERGKGKPSDSEDPPEDSVGVDADSSENILPSLDLDINPLSGKAGADRGRENTIFDAPSKGDSSGQERQDNSVQKSSGDPILYTDDPENDTGYFGYFITFIGVCGLAFILFHNKKRIIALCIEGRQKPAGRRRSRSGSAAYRKLENNFE